jgi:hypothetical protein
MQLNLRKCKSISFTRSRFTRHFQYELSGHRLDSVDSICDLGVVRDSKLNFTSHIDYLIVQPSRMLGYIRRYLYQLFLCNPTSVSQNPFRDLYTLKTLYNSFVRSHLDYASVVWTQNCGGHLKRIEVIRKKVLKFALRTLGWRCDIELLPYCQRCRLIDLDVLSSRRRVSCALFISDVLSCKLDCPIILSSLRLNFYLYWVVITAYGVITTPFIVILDWNPNKGQIYLK